MFPFSRNKDIYFCQNPFAASLLFCDVCGLVTEYSSFEIVPGWVILCKYNCYTAAWLCKTKNIFMQIRACVKEQWEKTTVLCSGTGQRSHYIYVVILPPKVVWRLAIYQIANHERSHIGKGWCICKETSRDPRKHYIWVGTDPRGLKGGSLRMQPG